MVEAGGGGGVRDDSQTRNVICATSASNTDLATSQILTTKVNSGEDNSRVIVV